MGTGRLSPVAMSRRVHRVEAWLAASDRPASAGGGPLIAREGQSAEADAYIRARRPLMPCPTAPLERDGPEALVLSDLKPEWRPSSSVIPRPQSVIPAFAGMTWTEYESPT